MVEMSNQHPMFQFLFDSAGTLMVANKQAMVNLRGARWTCMRQPLPIWHPSNQRLLPAEHLGDRAAYTLEMYLSIGQSQDGQGPCEMSQAALKAIFTDNKPCHRQACPCRCSYLGCSLLFRRFPQLRSSRSDPGRLRWVLYEMWPLVDPVTKQKAVLVCEQNITQVAGMQQEHSLMALGASACPQSMPRMHAWARRPVC